MARWQINAVEEPRKGAGHVRAGELLAEGWEPFAVTGGGKSVAGAVNEVMWFRRPVE